MTFWAKLARLVLCRDSFPRAGGFWFAAFLFECGERLNCCQLKLTADTSYRIVLRGLGGESLELAEKRRLDLSESPEGNQILVEH